MISKNRSLINLTPTVRLFEELRGLPRSRSDQVYTNLESMVLIASEHDLDPKQLIDAFSEALENGVSNYDCLKISCRKVNQDSATILITKEEKVVWQFPVDLEIITNKIIRDSIREIPIPKKMKMDQSGRNLKIGQLRFGIKGVNVLAKIIEIPPTKEVITRWGSQAWVSNIKLADETGSIRVGLWNDQITMVNLGDEIEIKNCSVARFAGDLQLRLGRKSTISVINQLQQD